MKNNGSSAEKTGRECVAFWLRRDLRFEDNHGLQQALDSGLPVMVVFIFDRTILERLPKDDSRVGFIHHRLNLLREKLEGRGAALHVLHTRAEEAWQGIFKSHKILAIFCNEDYEPEAILRDQKIAAQAAQHNILFHGFKDQVIFAKSEVVKDNGEPYRVFTPYSRKWLSLYKSGAQSSDSGENLLDGFLQESPKPFPSLQDLGFKPSSLEIPSTVVRRDLFRQYSETRNRMDLSGTSKLGLHLRFGTISIRKLVQVAAELSPVFLNELIWREFFMQILYHFPRSAQEPFDARYANIPWIGNAQHFARWCRGETGYPIVDAGMRELNATGLMHNRARMVTASFLCKHLLIDWRWGERYFAEKLLDFELSSNVGNWQWSAGCGCDAAPYFRVFNPALQQRKFDPHNIYVKRWVLEYGTHKYPAPIVDHEMARKRAIGTYRKALELGK